MNIMGKLTIYRKKSLDFSPIHMVINDEIIPIKNGENKIINLPSGTYGISVKGIFGLGGNAKVEIKENESKNFVLTPIISTEYTLVAIGFLLLMYVLNIAEFIPSILFVMTLFFIVLLNFLCSIISRRKYYKLKDASLE